MSEAASTHQSGAPPPAHALHHEMRNAENSAAFLLPKLRSMKESNANLTLLDVGAGSGSITATLAKLIPDSRVTAIDVNPKVLPRARAVAEMAGAKNVEFREGNVFGLPFPDASFDVTFCHQVLTHLDNPSEALREMLRVTKAGGVVAVREGDYETECVWPELPGLTKFHKFVAASMGPGATSMAGRQLLPWALKVGVKREQIALSFSTWAYSSPSERKIWGQALVDRCRAGAFREKGLTLGVVTEDDFEEMTKAWEEWIDREDACVAMMSGEILIEK